MISSEIIPFTWKQEVKVYFRLEAGLLFLFDFAFGHLNELYTPHIISTLLPPSFSVSLCVYIMVQKFVWFISVHFCQTAIHTPLLYHASQEMCVCEYVSSPVFPTERIIGQFS